MAEVFRDKRVPEDTTSGKPMPQQLMEAAQGCCSTMDTLIVSGGRLRYREFPEKGLVPERNEFYEDECPNVSLLRLGAS